MILFIYAKYVNAFYHISFFKFDFIINFFSCYEYIIQTCEFYMNNLNLPMILILLKDIHTSHRDLKNLNIQC